MMSSTALTVEKTPSPSAAVPARPLLLQRKCACSGSAGTSGDCDDCADKRLQRRAAGQREPASVPPLVNDVLRSPGQPLDDGTRGFMESRFGHSFQDVRVHTDDSAAESAKTVDALAYTVDRNIVFARGQYDPTSSSGKHLLAHELTHVMQQRSAPRGATVQASDASPYDRPDSPSEREADQIADHVLSGGQADPPTAASPAPIQRQGMTPARAITMINVNMNNPQNVSLDWSDGTHTTDIECSTGQGHCCPRPCDPPRDAVNGSNCTPGGSYTVDAKYRSTGALNYFVSFVAARSIGLHEYDPVDGTPLSHGCVRLHRADAATIYNGSVPGTTTVNVAGLAIPNCPRPRVPNCPGATGGTGSVRTDSGDAVAQNDQEPTSERDA
jgi:hypothetical protein